MKELLTSSIVEDIIKIDSTESIEHYLDSLWFYLKETTYIEDKLQNHEINPLYLKRCL